MKVYSECLPCFLKRVRYEIRLVTKDDELAKRILRECSRIIACEKDTCVNSAELSTRVHRVTYDMLGNDDPYRDIKNSSNEVALKLYPRAERFVSKSNDRFGAACIVSIVGNIFDYGITDFRDPKMMYRMFDSLCADGLGRDDTPRIKKILSKSRNVLFFTDNCGEVIFDRLLLREIKKYGVRLTLIAKGVPILSDATVGDIRRLGIDKLVDRVVGTESFAVGVDLENMSPGFRKMIKEADIIICKGMANYEAFSDHHGEFAPIAYLMRTKCASVADSAGVPEDKNIALLIR
jgi:hypothetical protein